MCWPSGDFPGSARRESRDINDEMKIAAAYAIAAVVPENELSEDYLLPKSFDKSVGPKVAAAVARAAVKSGAARLKISYEEEYAKACRLIMKLTSYFSSRLRRNRK
jgi:malate dehydrogenase (oxaloacetate-decarboxylating)